MRLEDDMIFDLEDELGTIKSIDELCPGVYNVGADEGGTFFKEYYIVLDGSPLAEKVKNYGRQMEGFRLYAQDDDTSGWRIVQYEVTRHNVAVNGTSVVEALFRDATLHAMELHPEYFGAFPVPFHTPFGYTMRSRTLANGIYWLETSLCKEALAVCYPVWNAELSLAARMLCEEPVSTMTAISGNNTDYIFFSKDVSCIPLYELMETHREWEGTIIDCPALMNAIWECLPQYALHLNGEKVPEFEATISILMNDPTLKALPDPAPERMVYMYPDAGTDFLRLP